MKIVVRNTAYLTAAHLVAYVIPLLEIPILARALGPTAYGQLVLIQSVALMTSLIVEYGFNLSSSREVAKNGDDQQQLGRIFSNVLAAKLLLTASVASMLGATIWLTPISIHNLPPDHITWGFVYFFAFAFSPFWFFLGREKVGGIIFLELCLRLTCLVTLYLLVKEPEDASLALALLASTGFANTLITNALCLRHLSAVRPRLKGAIDTIRSGFNVFVYRSSNTVLVTAAPALIGAFAHQTAVGVFVPAEKVIRGVVGLSTPVFTATFPHFSRTFASGDTKSYGTAWVVVMASAALGALCAAFLYFFGPPLVLLAIGSEFTATAELLKWFVWLIPLRITSQALGLVVLIPSGRDRQTSHAMIFFSLLSLLIGALLVKRHGALGMVISLLACELGLATVLLFIATQRHANSITTTDKR